MEQPAVHGAAGDGGDDTEVDLSRLESGRAPVLDSHIGWEMSDVLGNLDRPRIETATDDEGVVRHELVARATFPKSDNPAIEAKIGEAWDRLRIGLVRSVSVRFQVWKWEKIEIDGEATQYIARHWEPLEGSLVPIPADADSYARSRRQRTMAPNAQPANPLDPPDPTPEPRQAAEPPEPEPGAASPEPAAAPPAPVDVEAQRQEATAIERERAKGIRTIAEGLTHIRDLTKEAKAAIDAGTSVEDFQRQILRTLSTVQERAGDPAPQISVTADETDKRRDGMEQALLWRAGNRAGLKKHLGLEPDPGEYRSMGLMRIAEECVALMGVSVRGLNPKEIAGIALGIPTGRRAVGGNLQPQGDFQVVLENVMNKQMQVGYGMTPHTYNLLTTTRNAADFRPHYMYRMSAFGQLDPLGEAGEFKWMAIPDGERGTYQLGTWGDLVGITRQAIVNDDLGALMDIPLRLGMAYRLTKEERLYELIKMNSGLGPSLPVKLADGSSTRNSLWHADHDNLAGTATALTPNAANADCLAMSEQKDPGKKEYLGLTPDILLVANQEQATANLINTSEYNAWDKVAGTSAQNSRVATNMPNITRGKFKTVIHTPRLTGTRRYYFADPFMAPVFCFSYLNGVEEPMIESYASYERDGMVIRILADFGLDPVDFRGTYSNAGV